MTKKKVYFSAVELAEMKTTKEDLERIFGVEVRPSSEYRPSWWSPELEAVVRV